MTNRTSDDGDYVEQGVEQDSEYSSIQQPTTRYVLRLQSFVDHYEIDEPPLSSRDHFKNKVKKQFAALSFECLVNGFLEHIPLLRCLKEYNIRKNLFGDIFAGITVAIMHIPQGMAYGILTGLAPVHGLYVSFFPVLIYMIFGTCPHLSVGTFAVISLMIAQAIDGVLLESLNITNSDNINNQSFAVSNATESFIHSEKVSVATTLALLVGLIQILLSFLRFGFLTVYLTEPFISGFTTGAAIHVFSSQVPLIFGLQAPSGIKGSFKLPKFYVKIARSIVHNINLMSTAVAFVSIVTLLVAKQLNDRFKSTIRIILPCELILVIIGTIVSHFTRLHTLYGVSIVGSIKRGLPPPVLPSLNNMDKLLVPAITITAVSLSISISLAKMFSRKHGYKVSSNQELLAHGMANTISSFFLCYPHSGSLSRSVVQEGSGGKTQLIGGFSCLVLAVVIVVLSPLFHSLPMACLAAVIVVNLKGLFFQFQDFVFYYRISTMECILWTITFITVVLFDVDIGLYVGICTSFLINTIRTQKPRFVVLGQVANTEIYKDIKRFPSAYQYPNIKILRFDESIYACNAPFFKRKFYNLIGIQLEQTPIISCGKNRKKNKINQVKSAIFKYVILDCSPLNYIDTVGVKLLVQLFNDLKKRGIVLYLCECRYGVRRKLDLMEFYEKTAFHSIFMTTHDAVMAATNALHIEPIGHDEPMIPADNHM